jgi:hypothetical protein
MSTLIDPDVLDEERERLEAEVRTIMAIRAGLKQMPGTHGKQVELLDACDGLLDQWLAIGSS